VYDLPEPPATTTGQATNPLTDSVIRAAVENAIHEARRHGTAPAAQKPERPAMSQKATDDSVRMIAFGGMSLMVCAGGGIVMVASDFADPTVIGVSLGGLTALILAVGRLLGRAKGVLPDEIHQTYTGTVYQDQRNVQNKNTGVWVKNTNEQ
jgi:hypothetical protein